MNKWQENMIKKGAKQCEYCLPERDREKVFRVLTRRLGYICEECGKKTKQLEIHHVVPLRHGGTNSLENLEMICEICHLKRHGRGKHINIMKKYGIETSKYYISRDKRKGEYYIEEKKTKRKISLINFLKNRK